MRDIDEMDVLGYMDVQIWNIENDAEEKREREAPRKYIDETGLL